MSDPTYFHGPGLGRLGIPSVGERPFVASSFLLFRYRTLKQKVNRLDARASSLLKPRLINNGKVSFLHFFPLADDIACEDRKETDQHLSGTPDSMIASQRTETEAGLEISTMAAGTKNQLASRLRVVDFVLLWAHDYPVLPPSFLPFKGTRFITERKTLRSRAVSREVAREKAHGAQPR